MSSLRPDLAPPERGSPLPVLAAALGVAVLAVPLAGLGLPAVYAAGALLGVLVAVRIWGADLRAGLGVVRRQRSAAVQRLSARRRSVRSPVAGGVQRGSAWSTHEPVRVAAAVMASATGAALLGFAGSRAVVGVAAVLVLSGLGWLAWPFVAERVHLPAAGGRGRLGSRRSRLLALATVGALAGAAAWVGAGLGAMALVATAGAIALGAALVVVPDRHTVLTFATAASAAAMLHKSFGPQDQQLSGGAVAVYVTTTDVLVLAAWVLWWREGTLRADLREGLRRPVVLLPIVGAAGYLPSLLVAPSLMHAAAELTRMAWMALLYVYLAVRVRQRQQIWAALAGLVSFAAVQFVVVLLQWRTGGVLGLSFLGVPTELGDRVTDSAVLGRPFGTIIHPVFLGAALGTVAVLAIALFVELRRPVLRALAAGVVVAALACIWLAQARAAFISVAVIGVVLIAIGVRRGRIGVRPLVRGAAAAGALGLVFLPQIIDKLSANFGTGHFFTEIRSRLEINEIAERMFQDSPFLGVGLNNFEVVLPAYEQQPVIFFGHPVHNLYLLYLSETGLVGMIGFAVVGCSLVGGAWRLARSSDRLLRGVAMGALGVTGFFAVEELLGFALRQDAPLALFWIVAGLVAAGLRLASPAELVPARESGGARARALGVPPALAGGPAALRNGAPPVPVVRAWVPRRWVVRAALLTVGLLILVLAVSSGPAVAAMTPTTAAASGSMDSTPVVFSAVDRATGQHGVYLWRADGGPPSRITPADGRSYSWPRWAFGNTRIVYTVRSGVEGSPESIATMRPDGSDPRVVATFDFRIGQPIVEPDGRTLVFTATAPWFPHVALFRMDLATTESRNLTARSVTVGGFDADPTIASDGRIVFAWTTRTGSTSIADMAADGSGRRVLIADGTYNTDPAVSVDGRLLAVASYRGTGTPSEGDGDIGRVKPAPWQIAVRPRAGGPERVLTAGENCAARSFGQPPCTVPELSGVLPRFAPDGSVSFNGALDWRQTCICAIRPDGSEPRVLLASAALAIDWHDWPQQPGASTDSSRVGSAVRGSRVLSVISHPDGTRHLMVATPDLMHRTELALPAGLAPLSARWAPDRAAVYFTAKVPLGAPRAPHPAAPAGASRRAHVTLDDLSLLAISARRQRLDAQPADLAQEQVFRRDPDGTVHQLTDPWIEDWMDGLAPGDARANTAPSPTPDGRAVVVTNTSTLTGESFLLRIDLRDGSVRSLTNQTAGALPTDDSDPAVSPDGRLVAFSWTEGAVRGVHVMSAATGADVAPVTTDTADAGQATWSPSGSALAYSAQSASGSRILQVTVSARGPGPASPLSAVGTRAWSPVYDPDGSRVFWLQPAGNVIGLYAAPARGGDSQPVQPDPVHNVFSVDWR